MVCSPERWLIDLDHSIRFESKKELIEKAPTAYDSAVRCILAVLPDVDEVKIEKADPFFAAPEFRAQFKTPYGWVHFDELGQGYQSIGSWAIDLLQHLHRMYPERDKPETGPAVVLIDEFDLHLHPKWQLTLMNHLGKIFTNTQFIVTAHSPLIVQGAGPNSNLVVLKRVSDENGHDRVVADSDPVHIRGWRIDQIVTSDLFGMPSARPALYAELFKKRAALLAKQKRTKSEEKELKQITEKLETEAPPSISKEANDILAELHSLK